MSFRKNATATRSCPVGCVTAYWKEEEGREADAVVRGILGGRWLEAKGRRKGAVVVWWGFSWNGLVEVDLALGAVEL